MFCKLRSITFSHDKTNLDPSESLFFPSKPAGVHKKTISILMQLICATFRPLFLENICSRLLCNQMIMMLISHFHNILNAPVYLTTFLCENKATRWILTTFPRYDRVTLCICEVKGSRSYFSKFSFRFHLKDRHSKDVNFKFHLKQSSNFVYCSCLYLILCKLKGAFDKYNVYIFISTSIKSFDKTTTEIFSWFYQSVFILLSILQTSSSWECP